MNDFVPIKGAFEKASLHVIENASLAQYTTFKLGGPCPFLVECQTPQQVELAIGLLNQHKLPFGIIGGGSNLIISDQGVGHVIIRYFTEIPQIHMSGMAVKVPAGTKIDDLALYCAKHALAGLNFCSGIYGTVGGAIVGNAGAFGQQVSDCLTSVFVLTHSGEKKEIISSNLDFSYRDSIFKRNKEVILEACFGLRKGDKDMLLKERKEILALRRQKHPDINMHPCAGSIFRNLEVDEKNGHRQASGWLLEQAGAKNLKVGHAAIFEKHANIIINTGQASAEDVYALTQMMADSVYKKFKVKLIPEVSFLGEFSNAPR